MEMWWEEMDNELCGKLEAIRSGVDPDVACRCGFFDFRALVQAWGIGPFRGTVAEDRAVAILNEDVPYDEIIQGRAPIV